MADPSEALHTFVFYFKNAKPVHVVSRNMGLAYGAFMEAYGDQPWELSFVQVI